MSKLIRLTKRLAQTGRYSRRDADKLVATGRVTVDGVTALPGAKVTPDGAEVIAVSGEIIEGDNTEEIYRFYKPVNVLSSYYDPNNKKTLSVFPELAARKMGYSGRLDHNSEGLMLFTSDGDLIYRLQRSEFRVEKEYLVYTNRDISLPWMQKLESGLVLEEETFLPCRLVRTDAGVYRVILIEGKKRQVRRMFKAAGAAVQRLIRVRIGNILLEGLKPGELRKLTSAENKGLRKLAMD